jgi:hypothetical protein
MLLKYYKLSFVETALIGFTLCFPAFVKFGSGQAPLWLMVVLFFSCFRLREITVDYRFVLFITFALFICLFELLLDVVSISTSIYRLQIFLVFVLTAVLVRARDISYYISIIRIAILVNFSLILAEVFLPSTCDYLGLINRVRACVDGRPSGGYSEPSHLAFLILLSIYVEYRVAKKIFRVYNFILIMMSILAISGTLIGGLIFYFLYFLCKRFRLDATKSISVCSIFFVVINFLYLDLRLNEQLPIQQSYDKRSFYTIAFLNPERLLPSFSAYYTNSKFYSEGRYAKALESNEEVSGGYSLVVPASLSQVSTLLFVLGWPASILLILVILRLKLFNNIRNAQLVLLFWLGFPAALSVLPLIISMVKTDGSQHLSG